MSDFFFISYSSVDGADFAISLADELAAGPPTIPVWLDKRSFRPGEDWDKQVEEAIRRCKGLILVMSVDSVHPDSVCKNEWVRALKHKKPIIPLSRTEMPSCRSASDLVSTSTLAVPLIPRWLGCEMSLAYVAKSGVRSFFVILRCPARMILEVIDWMHASSPGVHAPPLSRLAPGCKPACLP